MSSPDSALCDKKSKPIVVSVDFPGPHCRNRLLEWTITIAFFFSGFLVFFWPDAWAYSAFSPILDALSKHVLAAIFLTMSTARGVALWANGHLPIWGPRIRSVGAVVGAVMLISMDIALIRTVFEQGRPPSPGIPFYTALFFAELFSARRAAADARIRLQ